MKSIVLIIPYFGKWPIWFPAFLKSCESNPSINWLFFTDCETSISKPKNVLINKTNLESVKLLAEEKLKCEIALTSPKKLCDLKPAYGFIFNEYIDKYDFWGFCDLDIIWGDIRKFITPHLLDNYSVITSLEEMISGHFTIFKNTENSKHFFKLNNQYIEDYRSDKHTRFDENYFSSIIKKLSDEKKITIFWDRDILKKGIESPAHQEYYLDKWQWQNGKMIDVTSSKEVMYLHFINWKRTMKTCEVNYLDNPTQFYISYNAIHYQPHSKIAYLYNSVKNFFNGYWVKEKRRIRKHKFKSIVKRIKRKLNIKHI